MTLVLVTLQTIHNNRDHKKQDNYSVFRLHPPVFVSEHQVTAVRFTSCIGSVDFKIRIM